MYLGNGGMLVSFQQDEFQTLPVPKYVTRHGFSMYEKNNWRMEEVRQDNLLRWEKRKFGEVITDEFVY